MTETDIMWIAKNAVRRFLDEEIHSAPFEREDVGELTFGKVMPKQNPRGDTSEYAYYVSRMVQTEIDSDVRPLLERMIEDAIHAAVDTIAKERR